MPPLCGGACASSKQAKFKRGLSGNRAALAAVGPQLPRNSVSALRQRVIGKTGFTTVQIVEYGLALRFEEAIRPSEQLAKQKLQRSVAFSSIAWLGIACQVA